MRTPSTIKVIHHGLELWILALYAFMASSTLTLLQLKKLITIIDTVATQEAYYHN